MTAPTNEELLPCPFCGGRNIATQEGSTFRWVYAYCADCGAQSGEVRKNTLADDQQKAQADAATDAIAQWNTRTARLSESGGACTHEPIRAPQVADGWVCHKCGKPCCGYPKCGCEEPWECPHEGALGKNAEHVKVADPETAAEADRAASPPTLSALVERQANDPALWFVAQTAPEAYLQKALRELHRAIEESPADLSEEAREVAPIIAWALGRLFQLSRQSAITANDGDDLRRIRALITRLSQRNAGLERALRLYRDSHHTCIEGEPQGLCNKCRAAEAALKGERT